MTEITAEVLTDGQREHVERTLDAARDGETTVVAVEGTRTGYKVVAVDDDEQRPFRVRWTIEATDGQTVTLDEWPPMTAEETAERDEAQAAAIAERDEAQAAEAQAAAEQADVEFVERVAAEVERVLAAREAAAVATADSTA